MRFIQKIPAVALAIHVLLTGACGLFSTKCEDPDCAQPDIIEIVYKSAIDSVNVFNTGQYALSDLVATPILIDPNGHSPNIIKSNPVDSPSMVIFQADLNLRGVALKLGNLPPDTLLMTTGTHFGDECCPDVTTVAQLLANGQIVPTIGSVIQVNLFK